MLDDDLVRAQRYRALAEQMRESAANETGAKVSASFLELARQYDRLAEKLLEGHAPPKRGHAANSPSTDP